MRKVNKRSVAQAMREMRKSPALSENWPALKSNGIFYAKRQSSLPGDQPEVPGD
jgi:hypothetical protein